MKRFQTSLTSFTRRLTFKAKHPTKLKSDIITENQPEPKEEKTDENKPDSKNPNLSNISDDNIQKTKELIEDIIFIHNYYEVKKLEKPNKKGKSYINDFY